MAYKLLVLLLTALLTSPSNSAEADLSWTEPTQNEDGTPLIDLTSYDIWYGCDESGVYDSVETLSAPATAHTVVGLPDVGMCYFAAKAINSGGESSAFSGEATRVMGSLEIPGVVTDTQITWRESVAMTTPVIEEGDITSSFNNSADTTPSVDYPAYESGDFLVMAIQADDDIDSQVLGEPANGPDGETLLSGFTTPGQGNGGTNGPTTGIIAWIGGSSQIAGSLDWSLDGAGEQWGGRTIIVPAGEFDASTSLGAISAYSGNVNDANMPTDTWVAGASDGGGKIVVFFGSDADAISAAASGWTMLANADHGAIAMAVGLRDAAAVDSTSITSVNFTAVATTSSSQIGFIIREPVVGGASVMNQFQNANLGSDLYNGTLQ